MKIQASQEQSVGIQQVNRTVSQMDHVVQSNAAQTDELLATARSLGVQAEQLEALVGRFKLNGTTGPSDVLTHARAAKIPTGVQSRDDETGGQRLRQKAEQIFGRDQPRHNIETGFQEF